MKLTYQQLVVDNFNNHDSLTISFSDITKIEGRNGAGKSSIANAITWLLYGTDAVGNKFDPKPIHAPDSEIKVQLLLTVDGKQFLLARTQKKTAKYYINEVPEKATAFNELVASMFNKELFLSIFNPAFFFTQHWQTQRSQLLQYIPEPLNKEVLAELYPVQSDELGPLLKKNSLDDIEKIHRERKNKQEKALERAKERVLTLKEQLEKQSNGEQIDEKKLLEQIDKLVKERDSLDEANQKVYQSNQERTRIQSQIDSLLEQVAKQKKLVAAIKTEEVQETCRTCGQALDEESVKKVKEEQKLRYQKEVQTGKELIQKGKALEGELSKLPGLTEVDRSKSFELDDEVVRLKTLLAGTSNLDELKAELETAEENATVIRNEFLESQSIVDTIKEFRTKKSELMVKKVNDLFTTISVRLYEQLKNGEEKATFEVEMDGKPYSKLSTAEKIKCGLELIDLLSKQSDFVGPTFVDNAESILKFTAPPGQLITARVVDKELTIQSEGGGNENE